ncbi:MAG: hypothetical protein M1818_002429 [Claussenomyces sp. TS43310]|nr:MAG: hypothetical protein M1818_002429 [Claussenomyces sp. TS43310]
MDDLNGLDWSASPNVNAGKVAVTGTGNYYPSLRPSPSPALSGRSTPVPAQPAGFNKASAASISKSSTPDSFSNLVSFGSAKQTTLTLQEQHAKLQAEKAKKEADQRQQYNAQFGDSNFWEGLGSKSNPSSAPSGASQVSAPAVKAAASNLNPFSATHHRSTTNDADEDDLFAAFNKDTLVDKSSHYPPPPKSENPSARSLHNQPLDLRNPQAWEQPKSGVSDLSGDDDDPFGLRQMGGQKAIPGQTRNKADDDDDFLGDLGKPVAEVRRHSTSDSNVRIPGSEGIVEPADHDDPWDKAVGELVDMGFSAEDSRRALTESGAGSDIQVAVGWLLDDAHRQAKEKSQSRVGSARPKDSQAPSSAGNCRGGSTDRYNDESSSRIHQEGRNRSQQRIDGAKSPMNSDEITKTAAAVGNNLLKTANSFWKTSQKKVQRAVADLQQDGDSSQPKWMRSVAAERDIQNERQTRSGDGKREPREEIASPSVTDEAMMLEADSRLPPRRTRPVAEARNSKSSAPSPRDQSPTLSAGSASRSTPVPRWQQSATTSALDAKSRLSKQAIEEQSAQAYVSPARRKKATPVPHAVPEPDLLFSDSSYKPTLPASQPTPQSSRIAKPPSKPSRPTQTSTPIPARPKAPSRRIPALSPSALASSTQHRLAGTAHFKRGDYASAHSSYSSSLSALPQGHPITIILLCNRSLTALKTGEPKSAVTDADAALNLIGVSRGEDETIDLQGDGAGEGKKAMKEFWGKALMRKAEALEQMERWNDAALVWKQAVEAGVGGATAAQGRQRCEKALQPKPKPTARPTPKAVPKPKPATLHSSTPASQQSTEAVNRLRAANAAAEKADDEKFALADSVESRVSKWRDGRKDNLRALLGGLDQVLWEGSEWKKIGMHELVMNGKVKINYMKAIAKVHPDKLPQNATTEMQMISAAVFSTLNEAWDKFKTENGM